MAYRPGNGSWHPWRGNDLGMMPRSDRAAEALIGGTDGNCIWESISP